MNDIEPHAQFPLTAYPDRPYDWSMPYDRELEDVLGEAPENPDPVTAYPYDQAGPYDWEMEKAFDAIPMHQPRHARLDRSKLDRLLGTAFATSMTIVALGAAVWSYASDGQDGPVRAEPIPGALPKPVKREADSAVKVEFNADLSSGSGGSGVKVGPDTVVTAGHVAGGDDPKAGLKCAGSYTYNRYTADQGWEDYIMDSNAIYSDGGRLRPWRDIAVLRVLRSEAFNALPTARVADEIPSAGDTVFFINYEQSGKDPDMQHYPAGTYLDADRQGYDYPAEYAGTVLESSGTFMEVATGVKGYGPKGGRQAFTQHGASGGPVFNQAGELVGETVLLDGSGSVPDINSDYGIKLPDRPDQVQLTGVQPVTRDILQPLLAGLSDKPVC